MRTLTLKYQLLHCAQISIYVSRKQESIYVTKSTGLHSEVGTCNVSNYKSRGCEFDPGPVPYFLGDWSWNNFNSHSPPFRWPKKLKKIVGSNNFSAQFIKIISHYKKIGYNINVLQQTACLVVNPITVGNSAFLFICTPVGRTSDSMMVPT